MMERWMIDIQPRPVGLRYDAETERLLIGGYASSLMVMESIIDDYFLRVGEDVTVHRHKPKPNKLTLRYYPISPERWREGLRALIEALGPTVVYQASTMGVLWR